VIKAANLGIQLEFYVISFPKVQIVKKQKQLLNEAQA